jgi:hypothetical protein
MAAARVLNVLDYEELKEIINKVHFKAFGKTIKERKQSESSESFLHNEFMEILTSIREGISLNKK